MIMARRWKMAKVHKFSKNPGSCFKAISANILTLIKFRTEDPLILGVTVKKKCSPALPFFQDLGILQQSVPLQKMLTLILTAVITSNLTQCSDKATKLTPFNRFRLEQRFFCSLASPRRFWKPHFIVPSSLTVLRNGAFTYRIQHFTTSDRSLNVVQYRI